MEVSPSKISRMETGKRGLDPVDVASLLTLYRTDAKTRNELVQLAHGAKQPGWVQRFGTGLPKELKSLINQEGDAVRIRNYETMYVPGLLQTGEYARAGMSKSKTIPAAEVEERVVARLGRQAILTREHPPALSVIIEEAILTRPTGGPMVMAGQLRHLVERASRPHIEVRVIPHELSSHAGTSGPFVIMDFAAATPIVHLENETTSQSQEDLDEIATYNRIYASLVEDALSPVESVEFIARLARDYAERSPGA